MLSQLIYVSVRLAECSNKEIESILAASNQNNGKKNITGVLLYSKSKFLQVLEGDSEAILSLYDHIKLDDRHKNVVMINYGPIKDRNFPTWAMGSKDIDSDRYNYLTIMSASDRREFDKIMNGEKQTNAIKIINKLF
ncbi:MAG: BLUF domain-containing protein [Flammeovirgaceae bacterium]